ncbi:MAG: histidine phosphatase family protein [Dysgonamonadaceae bacterium]|jgi:broad specificity phosphatase PhoE|nr:histidine phosphatase family protein [Dysgonamonadaceae bacterium]
MNRYKTQIIKTVWLVRHGQSLANVTPVFQAADSPLTEDGIAQVRKFAARIAEIPFDVLISSPYERAKKTAEIISEATGKHIEYSSLFVERMKTSFIEGKPHNDEQARKIFLDGEKSLFTPGLRVNDGENYDDIISRADSALKFLENRSEENILVVTHGIFLRMLLARALFPANLNGAILKDFITATRTANTGLSCLQAQEFPDGKRLWQLLTYNDFAHLQNCITFD